MENYCKYINVKADLEVAGVVADLRALDTVRDNYSMASECYVFTELAMLLAYKTQLNRRNMSHLRGVLHLYDTHERE